MLFTEFNLHPLVMKGIEDAGFVECTPVQEMTLQKTLIGTDVMVQSQTGTGKTAAFLITIFHLFLTNEKYRHKKALILTPTRELAVQVEQDAQLLGKYCNLKIGCFYGGVGYATQDRLLKGNINLYIGTPGRLIDYQKSNKIDFLKFDIVIIDEADRMFDMGFIPDIRFMLKRMVPPDRRVTMLFSATLTQRVKHLAWEYMNEAVEIEINPEHLTVDLITQELYHIGRDEKFNLLLGILRQEKPRSALIFTNMKRTAERISRLLNANNVENDYISGDLPQKKRLQIIEAIKNGKTEILVATDVAARGLHIEELDLVINYDLPEDSQSYVHRIGRTARAGKTGKAISLACEDYVYNLEGIEKLIGIKIPVIWAGDDIIVKDAIGAAYHPQREKRRDSRNRKHEKKDTIGRGQNRGRERDRKKRNEAVSHREKLTSTGDEALFGPAPSVDNVPTDKKRSRNNRKRKKGKKPEINQQQRTQRHDQTPRLRLPKNATPEERLEYYRKKYGDNFEKVGTITGDQVTSKPQTLVESIKNIFIKLNKKKK